MGPKVLLLLFLFTVWVFAFESEAQEISLEFSIYRMDESIAKALEDRLIQGGDVAVATFAKLADFEKQRRVVKEDSVSLQLEKAGDAKKSSSEKSIVTHAGDSKDGLEIEVDVVTGANLLDFNLYAAYTREGKGGPLQANIATQVLARSGVPLLLCRWQWEDDLLLLIGECRVEGATGEAPVGDLVYLESSFFPSAADAASGRSRYASARLACRSGQRAKAEFVRGLDDPNLPQDDHPGLRVLVDPVLGADGSLELTAANGLIEARGGKARDDDGEKVSRLEMREADVRTKMEAGKPFSSAVTITKTGEDSKPDRGVVVMEFTKPD